MRVTRASVTQICAICERSLLMGEHAYRFAPDGPRRGRLSLAAILGVAGSRRAAEAPVAAEPILRRLSEPELAIVEAADLFNVSPFRRTIQGVARSLGEPQASILPLSGVSGEMIITVAWEISWYQYRVSPDAAQAVRLAERGHDLGDIEPRFREWNAQLTEDGRLMPDIARV